MSESNQSKGARFGTGLLVGFLAGSTAYFLFNTEKGEELRQELKQRWLSAREDVPELNELKVGDLPIKDIINILLFGKDSAGLSAERQPKLKIKNARRSKQHRAQKPKKFKGV